MDQPTRRQQRARQRHERVRGWRHDKATDTREAQIAAAWRAHRQFLKVEADEGTNVAAISNSRGVLWGKKKDHGQGNKH